MDGWREKAGTVIFGRTLGAPKIARRSPEDRPILTPPASPLLLRCNYFVSMYLKLVLKKNKREVLLPVVTFRYADYQHRVRGEDADRKELKMFATT